MEINKATQEFLDLSLEEKFKDRYELLENLIESNLGFGEHAFTTRWKVHALMEFFTPEEANIFVEEIKTWRKFGVKLVDIELVIDELGMVDRLDYNLEKVE